MHSQEQQMYRMGPDIQLAEELDAQIRRTSCAEALRPTMSGWSRTVRLAIGCSVHDLARRLKISQPAITKLEQNEEAGAISLTKLEMLADALDCDLVYGFVPRRPFAETARSFQGRQDSARKARRKLPRIDQR